MNKFTRIVKIDHRNTVNEFLTIASNSLKSRTGSISWKTASGDGIGHLKQGDESVLLLVCGPDRYTDAILAALDALTICLNLNYLSVK